MDFSAVIPAAGLGSRLGYSGPKALAPLCGRRLIDFVLDAVLPHVSEIVVVAAPQHRTVLSDHLLATLDVPVRIALQAQPTGSADAVRIGLESVSSPACVIAWCDQVGLRESTVAQVLSRMRAAPGRAVLPLVELSEPYVWFECDHHGRIDRVGRARDGDRPPARGMSDLGLFGLPATTRFPTRVAMPADREQDFVYQLPELSRTGLDVFTVEDVSQALAVNTAADLAIANETLGARV